MNSSKSVKKESKKTDLSGNELSDDESVNEKNTIDYLRNTPDFFTQHSDILVDLEIHHEKGVAISLIERQVGILRTQNKQLKGQLSELIDIAKENDQSTQRMHKLSLSLLSCTAIDACEVALDEILSNDFSIDAISLKLFMAPINEQPEYLFIEEKTDLSHQLDNILKTRKPQCGFFKSLAIEELFDAKANDVASMAVIPLYIEKNNCFGSLILGSNNIRRFNSDMGTVFLERLGEILSHRLITFF